ncbi:MAG: RNA polymerase sigma factor [Planctomycetes bacterium]|nr:RNA polymerase sigma factor [Planctomycetota bacterium]
MSFTEPEFRALFEDQRERLFRFLVRLTRNASDADDLLQETFLQVWRKRAQFDGRGALDAWLRRTAFRTYLNSRARRERRAALAPRAHEVDAEAPADRSVEHRDSVEFLSTKVRQAVEELPEGTREAFLLFRYDGLSCAEIAELTETNVKTVETRLLRATRQLSERLRAFRGSAPTW